MGIDHYLDLRERPPILVIETMANIIFYLNVTRF